MPYLLPCRLSLSHSSILQFQQRCPHLLCWDTTRTEPTRVAPATRKERRLHPEVLKYGPCRRVRRKRCSRPAATRCHVRAFAAVLVTSTKKTQKKIQCLPPNRGSVFHGAVRGCLHATYNGVGGVHAGRRARRTDVRKRREHVCRDRRGNHTVVRQVLVVLVTVGCGRGFVPCVRFGCECVITVAYQQMC